MSKNTLNLDFIWRTAGGDNTRWGLFAGLVDIDPTPKLRLAAQGAIQASAVFDRNETAYVADMAGGVQAFSSEGKVLWRIRLDGGVSATPVLPPGDDRLFVGTHTGWLYALKIGDGEVVWKKEIASQSDPRILSDLLYLPQRNAVVFNSWGGKFYALNADNGDELFSWDAGISPYSGASADSGGTIYCLRSVWEKGVQFVRVSSGGEETVLYTQSLQKKPASRIPVSAAPVIDEERGIIYFIANLDRESFMHAWQIKTGQILWSYTFPKNALATPALAKDGVILVAALDGFVYAIGAEGSLIYRYASGCEYLLASPVCLENGDAIVGDPIGGVHKIAPNGIGTRFFETERGVQSRPSFDRAGNLYICSTDKSVFVFSG